MKRRKYTVLERTPIGRATCDLLQLNRSGLVNIRKALFAYGVKALED